jgi:hypothetical protein
MVLTNQPKEKITLSKIFLIGFKAVGYKIDKVKIHDPALKNQRK